MQPSRYMLRRSSMHFVLSSVVLFYLYRMVDFFLFCLSAQGRGRSELNFWCNYLAASYSPQQSNERSSNLNYLLMSLTRLKRRREGKITPDLIFLRIGMLISGGVEDFNILITIIKKNFHQLPSKFVYSSLVPIFSL